MILLAVVVVSANDSATTTTTTTTPLPNVLLFIVDDLGWNQVGYHARASGNNEIQTPHIDAAAAAGIELNRGYMTPWYVSKYCICVGRGERVGESDMYRPWRVWYSDLP
jgi:hypothetical protein